MYHHHHRHILYLLALLVLATIIPCVCANTEKVIFVAPPAAPLEVPFPPALETLSPRRPAVRKVQVELSFEKVTEEFFALEALDIGRKYEVRVCWPATVHPLTPIIDVDSHGIQSGY